LLTTTINNINIPFFSFYFDYSDGTSTTSVLWTAYSARRASFLTCTGIVDLL
jgi:hypothetical protein